MLYRVIVPRLTDGCIAAAFFLTIATAPAAYGQAADPQQNQARIERFERTAEQIRRETQAQVVHDVPAGQRALIDGGGYLTLSYLSFDDQVNDNRAYRGYDLVGYGRVNLDGAHEFYLRGRATYRDFNNGDAYQNHPDHLEGHLEEGYYRFDLKQYLAAYRGQAVDGNFTVQLGRQFFTWGDGLVLSQYVDGASIVIERGLFSLSLLGAVTSEDLTVDFDSSRPAFERETRRAFYGAMVSARLGPHHPYAYVMVQRDQNGEGPFAVGPIATRFRYNSYYVGAGSTGALTDRLAYGAEFVYEGGGGLSAPVNTSTLTPVSQTNEDIQAFSASAHIDYLFNDARRSRIGAGVLYSSGDSDRTNNSNTFGGNQTGTKDHGYNALGFVDDGLAFAPSFSNLLILHAGMSTYPLAGTRWFDQLQFGAEVYAFAKTLRDAAIDEPTSDQRWLGWEPDLFVNWQITDDITLALRYGIFVPGEAIESNATRQFFYAGVTYAF